MKGLRAGAASADMSMMDLILESVRARATVGEISDALREVWGTFRPTSEALTGVSGGA